MGTQGSHTVIHKEPQGYVAPRGNISLEVQAFPQLEAIGESLSAPVIWKGDPRPQVTLDTSTLPSLPHGTS